MNPTERWAVALPAALCLLLFFFPVVTTTFPIVGTRSQSGYDVVFSGDLHDISENVKATSQTRLPFDTDVESESRELPLSVRFAHWIPGFVAVMFISSAIVVLGAFTSLAAVKVGCVAGIASSVALVVFLKILNSDMHRMMNDQIDGITGKAGDDTFAGIVQGIGKMFASGFDIAPASGLYVIAAALTLSLFLATSRVLSRVSVIVDGARPPRVGE